MTQRLPLAVGHKVTLIGTSNRGTVANVEPHRVQVNWFDPEDQPSGVVSGHRPEFLLGELAWTVVYRKAHAPTQFKASGFAGTWTEAANEARVNYTDDLEVWYVPLGDTHVTLDNGRRVGIKGA